MEPLLRENHLQKEKNKHFYKFSSNCEIKTSILRQGIHVLLQIYHVIDIKGTHDMIDITTVGVPLAEASYEDGCPQWPRRS